MSLDRTLTAWLARPVGRVWMISVAVLVVWTMLALILAGSSFLLLDRPEISLGQVWAVTATDAYSFAVLTPMVVVLVRRLAHWPWAWFQQATLYVLAGAAFVIVHLALYLFVVRTFGLSLMEDPPTLAAHMLEALPRRLYINVTVFAGMVALVWMGLYAQRYRARELRAAHLETQLAEARLALLQQQIDSHFLFNTLHSISELIHAAPHKAEAMLMHLSTLLHVAFRQERPQQVPLAEEIELLNHYLAIQEVRYGDRLSVTMDVAPDMRQALIPSLALQTLVENAIRHGIAQTPGPGTIVLEAFRTTSRTEGEACLHIAIRDNGHGLDATTQLGVGLSNTHARFQQLYGTQYDLRLEAQNEGGTAVVLQVPLQFHANDGDQRKEAVL